MNPPDPNSASFDSVSDKMTDEIIERAYSNHPLDPQAEPMAFQLDFSCHCGLSPLSRRIITSPLALGSVLSSWKHAIIHPTLKPSSPDFRPISLLRELDNITERPATWTLKSDTQLRPNELGCPPGISAVDAARMAHHRSC